MLPQEVWLIHVQAPPQSVSALHAGASLPLHTLALLPPGGASGDPLLQRLREQALSAAN